LSFDLTGQYSQLLGLPAQSLAVSGQETAAPPPQQPFQQQLKHPSVDPTNPFDFLGITPFGHDAVNSSHVLVSQVGQRGDQQQEDLNVGVKLPPNTHVNAPALVAMQPSVPPTSFLQRAQPRNIPDGQEEQNQNVDALAAFFQVPLVTGPFPSMQAAVEPASKEQQWVPSSSDRMGNLREIMLESEVTQQALQEWDRSHGLPKSHCTTMVKTSRSRRQLIEGKILPKWDGTPLISNGASPVKPRRKFKKKQDGPDDADDGKKEEREFDENK